MTYCSSFVFRMFRSRSICSVDGRYFPQLMHLTNILNQRTFAVSVLVPKYGQFFYSSEWCEKSPDIVFTLGLIEHAHKQLPVFCKIQNGGCLLKFYSAYTAMKICFNKHFFLKTKHKQQRQCFDFDLQKRKTHAKNVHNKNIRII